MECVQLVKSGSDDLRQDAVMQQFFALVNSFLAASAPTRQRSLSITTYKVTFTLFLAFRPWILYTWRSLPCTASLTLSAWWTRAWWLGFAGCQPYSVACTLLHRLKEPSQPSSVPCVCCPARVPILMLLQYSTA